MSESSVAGDSLRVWRRAALWSTALLVVLAAALPFLVWRMLHPERAVAPAAFDDAARRLTTMILEQGEVPAPFEPDALRPTAPRMSLEQLRVHVGEARRALDERQPGHADNARDQAFVAIARYALGEILLAEVTPVDPETWFQLGWLLWRERQFDRALTAWQTVRSDYRVQRALHELVALRRQAPAAMSFWPYAMEALMESAPDLVATVEQEVRGRYLAASRGDGPREPVDRDVQLAEQDSFPSPDGMHLLLEHRTFLFADGPARFSTGVPVRLTLRTAYGGEIRVRFHAVPDLATLMGLDADGLVARARTLPVVREVEEAPEPLHPITGVVRERTLAVAGIPPGCYLAVAEARYCPVLATARFLVSDRALLAQVASNRVVVFAADHSTGMPRPGTPLRVAMVATGDGTGEPTKTQVDGVAGPDGLFSWQLPELLQHGREYEVTVQSLDPQAPCRVRTSYRPDGQPTTRAVVWTDRTVYRPGETVAFAGVVRRFDGESLLVPELGELRVEFGRSGGSWTSVMCRVDAHGTVHGTLPLPADTRLGDYRVRAAGSAEHQVFTVQEFRAAEFEVVLRHAATVRAGLAVDVEIQAVRFDGEPVAGATVHLIVASRPRGSPAPDRAEREAPHERRVKALLTDALGVCRHRLETPAGTALEFELRALALDPRTLRQVSGASALVTSSPGADVRIRPDRPRYAPGETARLRILAPDAEVVIEELGIRPGRFEQKVTLVDGAGACDYPVPADPRQLRFGVWDGEAWVWQPLALEVRRGAHDASLSVALDRAAYRIGETARITVGTDGRFGTVLLLLATGRIHEARMLRMDEREAVVEVPVRTGFVPEIHACAWALRDGELYQASATLDVPPDGRRLTVEVGSARTEYRPGDPCQVRVQVRDAAGRPVPDAVVALAVADEAVLALAVDATPELFGALHRFTRKLVCATAHRLAVELPAGYLWKVPLFVDGSRPGAMAFSGVGGGGGKFGSRFETAVGRGRATRSGGDQLLSPQAVRSDFRPTAFWAGELRTDDEGLATAQFALPDSTGAFRCTARAVAHDHAVGEARSRFTVRQPFLAQVLAPRVFQEGDAVAVTGLLRNHTGAEVTVTAEFTTSLVLVRGGRHGPLRVAEGGIARIECVVRVPEGAPPATVTLRAQGEGCGDALTVRVPCVPAGVRFRAGVAGRAEADSPVRLTLPVPPDARRDGLTVCIDADGTLEAALLRTVEDLVAYPYGCVEQTMSRFLPAVAAATALGTRPHALHERLPSVLAAGLERLRGFQHADGGFGWWQHDPTHDVMTAYVVFGLARCHAAGTAVDGEMAERAAQCLAARLRRLGQSGRPQPVRLPHGASCDVRAFMARSLAEHQRAFGKTHADDVAAALALPSGAEILDRVLLAQAAAAAGGSVPAGLPETSADPVELAGLIECRLARGEPTDRQVGELLALRRGRTWRTTLESAYAVLALARVVERGTAERDGGHLLVRLPGQPERRVELSAPALLPVPAAFAGSTVELEVTHVGTAGAAFVATLQGLRRGSLPETSAPLWIAREYWVEGADHWVPAAGRVLAGATVLVGLRVTTSAEREFVMVTDPRPMGFEPIEKAAVLDPQRSLRNRPGLVADARQARFRAACAAAPARAGELAAALLYQVAAEARAPSAPPAQPLAAGQAPTALEQRDDRMVAFFTALQAGETRLYYLVRAECEGTLVALPPSVEPMYSPEACAVGQATPWVVGDGVAPAGVPSAGLPPAGLARVAAAVTPVDAEALLAALEERSVPEVLHRLLTEPGLRAWLGLRAPAPASAALRDRVEAARVALEWRRQCTPGLAKAPAAWAPAIAAAITEDESWRAVADAAADAIADADNLLLWADADREHRQELFRTLQHIRGTREVTVSLPRPVTVPALLAGLGSRAPAGDVRVHWLLGQRIAREELSLAGLLGLCTQNLGIVVRAGDGVAADPRTVAATGTVRQALERALAERDLYFAVRDGALWVGSAEFVSGQ